MNESKCGAGRAGNGLQSVTGQQRALGVENPRNGMGRWFLYRGKPLVAAWVVVAEDECIVNQDLQALVGQGQCLKKQQETQSSGNAMCVNTVIYKCTQS